MLVKGNLSVKFQVGTQVPMLSHGATWKTWITGDGDGQLVFGWATTQLDCTM